MSHHMKEFEHLKIKLEALESATNNFSKESTIGIGGFGRVYKGKLAHSLGSKIVALKSLDRRNGQGDVEFWNEITILSSYQHENIVSLLGYCDESGERILVYEYETRGSLERYLNNDMLTWVQRLKISIGVARGLVCLHSEDGPLQRVLHCDIKSSNILLDENLNSKISDFGLANIGHANSQMAVAIRCWHTWVLCGRVTMVGNNKQMDLVELVKQYNEQNRIEEIIFGNIKDQINATSFGLFTTIASQCLKEDPQEGPLAIHVVRALEAALHCQMNNIKFSEQPVGILNVKIIKAIDLKRVLRVFAPNSYVNLRLTEDEENVASKNTKVVDQGVNPEWNEEFNTRAKDESTDEQWINVHANTSKNLVWNEKFEFTFDKAPTDRTLTLRNMRVLFCLGYQVLDNKSSWCDIFDVKEQQGIDRVHDEKRIWFEVELQGAQGDHEAEVLQVNNDDTAVAQRRLKDKQPKEKTNTDCLVKEQEKEYQTWWMIKTSNVLNFCNQRSTQQCMKSEVTKYLGVAGIQQQNELVNETNVTLFAKVISKWKAGLKDNIDARSDVYVLNNGKAEIWATKGLLDKAKGNVLDMEIVRDQSGNTLRVSQYRFYNRKLVQTLLEGHFILSLKGSLSGDCGVEKNSKWSCVYAVGS
ncbi:protein kinase, ATP binding site-containing protein [Tanacetum coccineum]